MIIPDDDFDRLMRRADPAITPLDEPLDRDSLAVLNSLMPEGRQLTGTVLSKAQWPWLVIPLTLAALMVVILVVQPWSFLGRPSPAAAAPRCFPSQKVARAWSK